MVVTSSASLSRSNPDREDVECRRTCGRHTRRCSCRARFPRSRYPWDQLRSQIGRDVRVRDWDAIDEPGGLVATAHVQHVVGHVRAWNVIGDHREAISRIGAGSLGDVGSIDERRRRYGLQARAFRFRVDDGRLADGSERQLQVKNR